MNLYLIFLPLIIIIACLKTCYCPSLSSHWGTQKMSQFRYNHIYVARDCSVGLIIWYPGPNIQHWHFPTRNLNVILHITSQLSFGGEVAEEASLSTAAFQSLTHGSDPFHLWMEHYFILEGGRRSGAWFKSCFCT